MTINLTLTIQIVNFLIAYWLLRVLLFKPAVEHITRIENDEGAHKLRVSQLEYRVEQERIRLANTMRATMNTLQRHYPQESESASFVFNDVQIDTTQLMIPNKHTTEEQAQIVQQLRKKVMI